MLCYNSHVTCMIFCLRIKYNSFKEKQLIKNESFEVRPQIIKFNRERGMKMAGCPGLSLFVLYHVSWYKTTRSNLLADFLLHIQVSLLIWCVVTLHRGFGIRRVDCSIAWKEIGWVFLLVYMLYLYSNTYVSVLYLFLSFFTESMEWEWLTVFVSLYVVGQLAFLLYPPGGKHCICLFQHCCIICKYS